MPKIKEVLFGKKDKIKQAKLTTPEQDKLTALISKGLTKGEGPLADIFGPVEFNEEEFNQGVKQPALKNFEEDILPRILEKYNAGGQVGGSGMNRSLLRAGTDLQSKLSELMYGAKVNQQNTQNQNRLQGLNSVLGVRGLENIYRKAEPGAVPQFVKGFAEGFGNGVANKIPG